MRTRVLLPGLLIVGLPAACSSPAASETWMPQGPEGHLVNESEARVEAKASIDEDNADAAYDDLLASDNGDN